MLKTQKPITLLSDQAIYETKLASAREDSLEFKAYATVIRNVIVGTDGPFTIGVFGEWGTGKTSLMKMVENEFEQDQTVVPVWFNAWKFEKADHPIVPLVATIIKALEDKDLTADGKKSSVMRSLIKSLRSIAYGFSINTKVGLPGFAEFAAGFSAKDMIERQEKASYDPLLEKTLYHQAFEALNTINLNHAALKILVIIDDLDRCFPENSVKLLESIKLVLGQPGFLFILGVSRKVIEEYLKHKYQTEYGIKKFQGHAYLDKIIQLPFEIPPHDDRMKLFVEKLINSAKLPAAYQAALKEIAPVIGYACEHNPRTVVRFLNRLIIDKAIYDSVTPENGQEKLNIPIGYFAVTRSLQHAWKEVFEELKLSDDKAWDDKQENELCVAIAGFLSSGRNDEELQIMDIIRHDSNLKHLLGSEIGHEWLKNIAFRRATLNFVITQPAIETPGSETAEEERLVNGYPIRPAANLRGADLHAVNLRGADLQEANLQEANLREAHLQGANLREANLQEANLREAYLPGANLREANLQRANLQRANFQGANLQEADLRHTDLRRARKLEFVVGFESIICDETTICTKEQVAGSLLEDKVTIRPLENETGGNGDGTR